jgi:3-isopropylmalate dehydrogenase
MFEPIGGSAPKYTGKNVINPMSAIGAAQMMLEIIGEEKASKLIEDGMKKTLLKMKSMDAGKMGMSTTDVGDDVANNIAKS